MIPVILSGGSGTRLWPLSRAQYPKQFLPLLGRQSLFELTLARVAGIPGSEPPLVVCNDEHRFIVAEQAQASGMALGDIVLEPVARNTAPAVAVAALAARRTGADPLLLVLPSDHVIEDAAAFRAAVAVAAREAEAGNLVTFGVRPTRPETGYGYIRAGMAAGHGGSRVGRFVEKPDRATAEAFLAEGGYFWNSGMFVFRASAYLDELARHAPAMLQACAAALESAHRDLDFLRIDSAAFAASPSDSIDYAVMEKTGHAVMVPLDAGWSDVGSWDAVWRVSARDDAGNALAGNALVEGGTGNFVHAGSRLVGLCGVNDLVVVETSDAVLVASRADAQDLKRLVGRLTESGHPQATEHRKVHRPWGSYDALQEGTRYKVKHLSVKPGERLSVQLHHRRAEHWVVVAGTARVLIGTEVRELSENESIYIPRETRHSLENPGVAPLELIEVQTGDYLGEDDIVRFEDRYGRA